MINERHCASAEVLLRRRRVDVVEFSFSPPSLFLYYSSIVNYSSVVREKKISQGREK